MNGPRSGITFVYRENPRRRRLRRIVDVGLATLLLMPSVPVLALASLAILLEDGRPVLFRQQRAGRFERPFTIYKLRTMRLADCGDRPSPKSGSDSRLTAVGRFMRRSSIDELPQLINVIRGEMSIVGPRPEMAVLVPGYESWQHLRHLISPGLTCIWQTTVRSTIPLNHPEATLLDLDYIRRASPLLDGRLLLNTVLSLLFPKGAF